MKKRFVFATAAVSVALASCGRTAAETETSAATGPQHAAEAPAPASINGSGLQSRPAKCTFFMNRPEKFHDGTCLVAHPKAVGDRYRVFVDTGETLIDVVSLDRQGEWARVSVNGQSATQYELSRGNYSLTTDDLNIRLSYEDR